MSFSHLQRDSQSGGNLGEKDSDCEDGCFDHPPSRIRTSLEKIGERSNRTLLDSQVVRHNRRRLLAAGCRNTLNECSLCEEEQNDNRQSEYRGCRHELGEEPAVMRNELL